MGSENISKPDHVLDAGETGCGDLIMMIFQQMKQLQPGQTLQVTGYDRGAAVDIPAWCRQTGNSLISFTDGSPSRFLIQKG